MLKTFGNAAVYFRAHFQKTAKVLKQTLWRKGNFCLSDRFKSTNVISLYCPTACRIMEYKVDKDWEHRNQ